MARARVPVVLAGLAVFSLVLGAAMAAGQASSSTKPLFATLNGKNEIGEDGKRNAGDRNGLGSFTAIRDGNRLCYAVVGAIRGQLGPRRSGGTASGVLVATISGQNEIGQDGSKGAGDNDGYGSFTPIRDGTKLCYGLTAANLAKPVAAHIHAGAAGANGNIVIPLRQPSGGDPGASAGCTTVDATLLGQIFANPAAYYVNVHTGDFPNGAARGQLQRNR
jgi:CHRD domain